MREIKFRVWSMYEKAMLSDVDLLQKATTERVRGTQLTLEPLSDDRVLMQFTGLKDKNGVEIYEGDIVLLGCSTNPDHKVKAQILQSEYEPAMCVDIVNEPRDGRYEGRPVTTLTMHSWVGSHSCLSFRYGERHEVIGNVYENPELIKD